MCSCSSFPRTSAINRYERGSFRRVAFQPGSRRSIGRENHIPIARHVYDSPAFRICFIESLVETAHVGFAIVGPFAVRIGVMHKAHKAYTVTRRRPLEHLLVTVGIAK